MDFSNEFFVGISFACVGMAGLSFLLSRRNNYATTEGCGLKNKDEVLEDENDKFLDAESRSFRSVSDAESRSFHTMSDAESRSIRSVSDEILNDNTTHVKSIGELYMEPVNKQAFRDLQHNFKVVEMNCLALKHHVADAIYIVQQTADEQRLSINGLRLEVSRLKKDLNHLTADLLKNSETPSAETNTEKSVEENPDDCKLRRLKMRVSVLESDVTKNSTEIIGITSAAAAADAVTSASFTPAAGPPKLHPVRRQSPPPPAVTSANFRTPTPPPSPPMTTGTAAFRRDPVQKPCASVRGAEEKELKTYCRVPITEKSLRSIVLKPVARRT